MLKFNEIEKLYELLQSSREKALYLGDYETAIEEHDQVIRQCNKLQKLCDINTSRKFEIIKEKCRIEIKILQDLLNKLKDIKKVVNNNKNGNNNNNFEIEKVDPDVWAPPTPIQSNRRNIDDNLPSWARNASVQNNPRPDPTRRQSSEEGGNGKIRRKDPIPENRRRYFLNLIDLFFILLIIINIFFIEVLLLHNQKEILQLHLHQEHLDLVLVEHQELQQLQLEMVKDQRKIIYLVKNKNLVKRQEKKDGLMLS